MVINVLLIDVNLDLIQMQYYQWVLEIYDSIEIKQGLHFKAQTLF